MKGVCQIAGLCFVGLSVFVVLESWDLEYYTKLGPGPGFFPFWLGVVMGALSLAWLTRAFVQRGSSEGAAILPDREGIARILSTLAALVAMAGLMNLLGFQLSMLFFMVFLLKVLGRQAFWMTIVVALLCSIGVYHLFGAYLDVPLPAAKLKFLASLGL